MRALIFPPIAAAALSIVVVTGCSRPHMSESYGRAYRDALSAQRPSPQAPPPAPSMSLDTQEAQVIGNAYFAGLAAKAKEEPESVIYVAPQRGGAGMPSRPQPSVPK